MHQQICLILDLSVESRELGKINKNYFFLFYNLEHKMENGRFVA